MAAERFFAKHMSFFALVVYLVCLPTALLDFALPLWKADPSVRIEDAYKWTYQATRGGEHAVPDEESARKWLDGEWESLGRLESKELVWEPLCPGAEIGRLNLRPYRERGGEPGDVLAAFLASSRDYRADGSRFLAAWRELGERLTREPAGVLNRKSWENLDGEMKAKNYPAIHHSKPYETAKRPAYRIMTMREMKKIAPK